MTVWLGLFSWRILLSSLPQTFCSLLPLVYTQDTHEKPSQPLSARTPPRS